MGSTRRQVVVRFDVLMSREHVSEDDEREGRVLACRVRPCSDVHLTVIGKMKKSVVRRVETADAPTSHST
jgi:ferredoxin